MSGGHIWLSSCQYPIVVDTFQWHLLGKPRRNPSKNQKNRTKNQKIRRNPSTAFCEHFLSFSESFQGGNQRIGIFVSGCGQHHKNNLMVFAWKCFADCLQEISVVVLRSCVESYMYMKASETLYKTPHRPQFHGGRR